MKMFKALERAEEGQHDCFWHDHSDDIRYLLVLPGATLKVGPETFSLPFSHDAGRVTSVSKEFRYLSSESPTLLPGAQGPLTVLLIL